MNWFFALSGLAVLIGCGSDKDADTGYTSIIEDRSDGGGGGGGTAFDTGRDSPSDTDSSSFDELSDWLTTTEVSSADRTCLGSALGTETAIPSCVGRAVTMSALVSDFQTSNPVDEARVEIFQNDAIVSAPDHDTETDFNGIMSAEMETCAPFTYRASTDPAVGLTKTTIQAHNVLPYVTTSTVMHDMNSVSYLTYSLISTLFGINPSPSNGVVFGRFLDCAGDNVMGAQVVVKNADDEIPSGVTPGYFIDDFPSKDQLQTSDDGLWMLIDVPPGQVTVEGYVYDGADYILMGSATLEVLADSVHIASIYTSLSDGLKMPDSCLASCE